jgi:hypothetical protein
MRPIYHCQYAISGYYSHDLEHYATSRKVAGSIPDDVIGFFSNLPNPSSRIVVLRSTQPLIEMSTRNLLGE